MKKRIWGLILVLCMLSILIPSSVFAEQIFKEGEYRTVAPGAAIKNDGSLWIWGNEQLTPKKVLDDALSLSEYGNYVIKTDNSLWTCELNPQKIMDNVKEVIDHKSYYPYDYSYDYINDKDIDTLVIKTDNTLWDLYGYLKDNAEPKTLSPVKIMDDVQSASFGYTIMAIKTDGTVWDWGLDFESINHNEELKSYRYNICSDSGYGGNKSDWIPRKRMDSAKYINAQFWPCIIDNNDTLWALATLSDEPGWDWEKHMKKVMDNVAISHLFPGRDYALQTDGRLWVPFSWGVEAEFCRPKGLLGSNYWDYWVESSQNDVRFFWDNGNSGAYILKNDNSLWAKGVNYLGTGKGYVKFSFEQVMDDVATISEPYYGYSVHALKNDNTLWSWGTNDDGSVGDGTKQYHQLPVKILDDVRLPSENPTDSIKKYGYVDVMPLSREDLDAQYIIKLLLTNKSDKKIQSKRVHLICTTLKNTKTEQLSDVVVAYLDYTQDFEPFEEKISGASVHFTQCDTDDIKYTMLNSSFPSSYMLNDSSADRFSLLVIQFDNDSEYKEFMKDMEANNITDLSTDKNIEISANWLKKLKGDN